MNQHAKNWKEAVMKKENIVGLRYDNFKAFTYKCDCYLFVLDKWGHELQLTEIDLTTLHGTAMQDIEYILNENQKDIHCILKEDETPEVFGGTGGVQLYFYVDGIFLVQIDALDLTVDKLNAIADAPKNPQFLIDL